MATVTTSAVDSAGFGDVTRRLFDIFVSTTALIILSPFMGLIMIVIALESGRPVFFSHTRLGQSGRPFRMHKF